MYKIADCDTDQYNDGTQGTGKISFIKKNKSAVDQAKYFKTENCWNKVYTMVFAKKK